MQGTECDRSSKGVKNEGMKVTQRIRQVLAKRWGAQWPVLEVVRAPEIEGAELGRLSLLRCEWGKTKGRGE